MWNERCCLLEEWRRQKGQRQQEEKWQHEGQLWSVGHRWQVGHAHNEKRHSLLHAAATRLVALAVMTRKFEKFRWLLEQNRAYALGSRIGRSLNGSSSNKTVSVQRSWHVKKVTTVREPRPYEQPWNRKNVKVKRCPAKPWTCICLTHPRAISYYSTSNHVNS